jgi:hypothetical protein
MTMNDSSSIKSTARRAGILYLVMSLVMIFSFMLVPGMLIVGGDAAATARNIAERELLYRAAVLGSVLSHILFILVVLKLYELFRDVDRKQARLILVLVCAGAAAELVNISNRVAPLILLSGADYLEAFTTTQLQALAHVFIRLNNSLGQMLLVIWGLWLIPFGNLTIKSAFFPKILGYLLYATGLAYMTSGITSIVFPDYMAMVSRAMFPLYFGELGIVFWMAIMGANVPVQEGRLP